ncbi:myb-like protein A [Gossypium australe]|uniref:Myb-like protein A n=1 Tax=Gossypium australe TaxID=47621 RepID=A0A5B6VUF0_9ROSI|nr:myb-like protein A [Gossypium australe]
MTDFKETFTITIILMLLAQALRFWVFLPIENGSPFEENIRRYVVREYAVGSSGAGRRWPWWQQKNAKEMINTAQNGEEDYSRLINIDGPFSLGMVIPEWRNDSGESSEQQPSVITDNENNLPLICIR